MGTIILPEINKRCVVTGTTQLCIFAIDELVKNGWSILCVVSKDLILKEYCKKKKLKCFPSLNQVNVRDFVLFSVANYTIISEKFLKSHDISLAINYHDSLLPRYSGVNSTTWAIYNNEKIHGVSWHLISSGIDEGDLLRQSVLKVDPNETAFSLNLKCFQEARKLFTCLLKDLESCLLKVTKQDETKRTYYGREYIPDNYGIINFNNDYKKIDRLHRSLYFGTESFHNPVASLKVWDGEKAYLVESIDFKEEQKVIPGRVYSISKTSLCIGINDGKLIINKLKSYDGSLVLIKNTKFQKSKIVASYNIDEWERVELSKIKRSEPKILNAITSEQYVNNSFFQNKLADKKGKKYQINIPLENCDLETVLCSIASVLSKFVSNELSVPIKKVFRVKSRLLEDFISQDSYINLYSDLQKLSYRNFSEQIQDYIKQEYLVPKDLFYRYNINIDNQDVAILISNDKSIKSNPHRLTIIICKKCIYLMGFKEDKLIIDTFSSSLNYVVNNANKKLDGCVQDLTASPPEEYQKIFLKLNKTSKSYLKHQEKRLAVRLKKVEPSNGQIKHFAENYFEALKSLCLNPDQTIEELKVLSKKETQRQEEWGRVGNITLQTYRFLEAFEKNVKNHPKTIAAVFEDEKIDYQTLNKRANQFAHYLHNQGVEPNTLIGVVLSRSLDLIVTLLSIMKAGCAYLPLDSTHPIERIQLILKDSKAENLITQSALRKTFSRFQGKTILLDKEREEISVERTTPLKIIKDLKRLVYVIYTSGSTGKPKGVEIEEGALNNLLCSVQKHIHCKLRDNWLALTTISFDISNLEILLPLSEGATVVLASEEAVSDPEQIKKLLEREKITIAQATPSTWQMLTDWGWKGKDDLTVLCGGESLPKKLANKLVNLSKNLWNMYGPTETTIWSSMKKITSSTRNISLGSPLDNTEFYVLDANKKMVPVGVTGELYIGGACLARGYRHRGQLTKERFVSTSFGKLYKTGDLVRYLSNGELEYIGRLDHQVKVRGYRIELGEIEEGLKQCGDIKQVVALVYENKPGDTRIGAYYQGSTSRKEIKKALKESLPSYMIPSVYIKVDQFPLTPNGKVDRKALPKPKEVDTDLDYLSPHNSYEEKLANIFETFLGIDKISIDANFFVLGGHSLLAAQAITEVNKMFCIDLPLRTLFECPTIETIAKQVEKGLKESVYPVSIFKGPKQDFYELSSSQRRLWFLEQLNPNTALYTIPLTLELSGFLERSCLQKAIKVILQRHEILRAVMKQDEEGVKQGIQKFSQVSIKYVDFSEEENPKQHAQKHISKEAKKSFDLLKGPLYRFELICLSEEKHFLFLNFHHIIFDGFSTKLLLEEIKVLYEAFLNGETPSLQEISPQYGDFVRWQERYHNRLKEKEDIAWWEKKLEGPIDPLLLPFDSLRPQNLRYDGSTLDFQIGKKELSKLRELAKKEKTTLFSVVLTVFHLLLSRYSSQQEMIIGVPISGRIHESLNAMMGCFIETLALRTTSKNSDTFKELLKRTKKEIIEAYKHQYVPFDKLVEKLSIERSFSHSPIFQVMLNMLPKLSVREVGGMKTQLRQEDRGQSHFDLSLSLQESSQGLSGIFEYSSELFNRKTIKRMVTHFINLLKEVMKDPNEKVRHYQFLSRKELKQQLIDWNKSSIKYDKNKTILELIESWAKKRPNTLAVVCGEETYTYRELNTEANKIAHTLLSQGIKPEDKVVICLDRSKEFIAAVLGVLKAGGVYVPMDPAEPKDRTLAIFRNLAPFCILSHQRIQRSFSGKHMIHIDQMIQKKTSNPNTKISPDQLAYIIYTSGSTGKPKGVEIEHRSINDRVLWKDAAYPQAPENVMLHTYSFIFDGAIINYFWPLYAGSTLVIASGIEQYDSDALVYLIQKYQVTTADMLPIILLGLIEAKGFERCTSLKNVFSGGEVLSNEVVRQFYKKCKTAKLYNTYGPTETTVEASVWECNPKDASTIAPIGSPIAGAKLYILDENLNVVPVGVAGELFIGGEGVARGYLNASSLTKEKFIQDPFSKKKKSRLYRTGDLVKYRVDGTIEFLGRIDTQIKIRGYRVELGEIESILLHMDPVEKTAVIAQGKGAHKQLVAYVQLNPHMNNPTFKLLMEHYLAEHLPAYMIPAQVSVIKKIPTLLNGKINYKALPKVKTNVKESPVLQDPKCKVEVHLVNIWREILKLAEISTMDNFFDVGGNSFLGMQLMSKINKEMDASIPLVSLFQHPTIKDLASLIKKPEPKDKWKSAVLMSSKGDGAPFFCVHPVGGNVLCYKELASCWSKDRPFYALQAQGLEKGQRPLRSIPSMAREYIKTIKEIQPKGPYLIGGWSFGGLVASEIVNQFEQDGDEVSLLVLIDTSVKIEKFKKIDVSDESLLFSELTHHYNVDPKKIATKLSPKQKLLQLIEWGTKKSQKITQGSFRKALSLAKANYRALQKFTIPKLLSTQVVVIRAKQNSEKVHDLGWGKYAENVEVFEADGDHWGLVHKETAPHYSYMIQSSIDLFAEEQGLVKSHA